MSDKVQQNIEEEREKKLNCKKEDLKLRNKVLKDVQPPVEKLLLICRKCGTKLQLDENSNPSELIQLKLKKKIKENLPKGTARTLLTTCMDICPEKAIALGYIQTKADNKQIQFKVLTDIDPDKDAEMLYEELCSKN